MELAINTHVAVSDTRIMVSDIHHTMVGSDDKNLLVSKGCALSITE